MRLRAVIFDVDGTLVDSQADILGAMTLAFQGQGLTPPSREAVLGIVGLSLDVAIPRLAPDQNATACTAMVQGYKDAYVQLRSAQGAAVSSPLYPGAQRALTLLRAQHDMLLGIATGKSRRGLTKLGEAHGWAGMFQTQQCADDHPSKPSPSMLIQAMSELGTEPAETVMIGDTSFDLEMARAAGTAFIGVSWGYHPRTALAGANCIIDSFDQLPGALTHIWRNARV